MSEAKAKAMAPTLAPINMSQDNMIKMECTVCKTTTHHSRKNKKIIKERLELSKYCNKCKKNTPHKETK